MSASDLPLPVGLVGYGISNKAVEKFLLKSGVDSGQIHIFEDSKGLPGETFLSQTACKSLCVSPGYPLAKSWIQAAKQQGIAIESEISIAAKALKPVREKIHILGVTGSAGKSTVVSLLEAGLLASQRACFLGGNIGRPLVEMVSGVESEGARLPEIVVLELSSYQLENMGELKLDSSLITSLSRNHLDRYPSLEAYYDTKINIFRITTGKKWACAYSNGLREFFNDKQIFDQFGCRWIEDCEAPLEASDLEQVKMFGAHSICNVKMAAALLADLGAWNESSKRALLDFPGLPHRAEVMQGKFASVFVNDSKSTTMNSVLSSVASVQEEKVRRGHASKKLFLLLGGRDKDHDWGALAGLAEVDKLEIIFFGESAEKAKLDSGLSGITFASLRKGCEHLIGCLEPGDWALLSPGGSSWDEFANFEERGRFFRDFIERNFV